jgi:hypothetical protein
MPTSEKPKPPERVRRDIRSYEGFIEGTREDRGFHEPILEAGDHEAAKKVGRDIARELGLSDDEIDALGLKEKP